MSNKEIKFTVIDGRKCLTDDELSRNPVTAEFFEQHRFMFARDAFNRAWYLRG